MKKEIMEIIESLNDSAEIAYIKEIKGKKEEIKTRVVDLSNGSKRYFVEVSENFQITYTSAIGCTHAVIGKESENEEYKAYGFHSKLELAQKKMKKFANKAHEIFIVKLV